MRYYEIPLPDADTPLLTQDTDFLGMHEHASALGQAMGNHVEVRLATLDDSTANVATLTWCSTFTGETLMIDIMGWLEGLKEADVHKRAQVLEDEHGNHFEIIHPFDLLTSRIANLHRFEAKRKGNGPLQAHLAVEICRCYILDSLRSAENKKAARVALNMAHGIGELARSRAGAFCNVGFGIDPLLAVDPSKFVHFPMFAKEDWPNQIEWAMQARDREKSRLDRAAAVAQRHAHKIGP